MQPPTPHSLAPQFANNAELRGVSEFIHFACTSEDVSNLAYGVILSQARTAQILPRMNDIVSRLVDLAEEVSKQREGGKRFPL